MTPNQKMDDRWTIHQMMALSALDVAEWRTAKSIAHRLVEEDMADASNATRSAAVTLNGLRGRGCIERQVTVHEPPSGDPVLVPQYRLTDFGREELERLHAALNLLGP